tara:strand:+ start:29 stop:763 length:735 start_codon:yes stop_codon:yes gene_type:complete
MSNTPTKGCPRCDDYDEVVEELNKEKESRKQEVKSELHKCEERHKKKDAKIKGLEKKILTMTIAAVVGGTIIGKEFINEITSYIKSFSGVKNAVNGLSGALPVITVSKNDEDNKSEDMEEINDYSTITFAPRKPSITEWPPMVTTNQIKFDFDQPLDIISLIVEETLNQQTNQYKSMPFEDDTIFTSAEMYDLTKYSMDTSYYDEEEFDRPVYTMQDSIPFVPESDAWALLILPCLMNKRRRRM